MLFFHTFTDFSYISTPLYTPKPQKPLKNQWFFNDFANPTFSVFYLSCTTFISNFTYFTSKNIPKSPLAPKLAPLGPNLGSPWPSWDSSGDSFSPPWGYLGTPWRSLSPALACPGAIFAHFRPQHPFQDVFFIISTNKSSNSYCFYHVLQI